MIALRLVHLIEQHSEELAETLTQRLLSSDRTAGLRQVPANDLHQRCHEVYRHLSDWLLNKTEGEIQAAYEALGARCASLRAPLSDLTWALLLTKENLLEFLGRERAHGSAEMVWGELELLRSLDQFFDRAVYFLTIGYERGRTTPEPLSEARRNRPSVDSLFAAAAFRSPVK